VYLKKLVIIIVKLYMSHKKRIGMLEYIHNNFMIIVDVDVQYILEVVFK
jgi:hypothetical protein